MFGKAVVEEVEAAQGKMAPFQSCDAFPRHFATDPCARWHSHQGQASASDRCMQTMAFGSTRLCSSTVEPHV